MNRRCSMTSSSFTTRFARRNPNISPERHNLLGYEALAGSVAEAYEGHEPSVVLGAEVEATLQGWRPDRHKDVEGQAHQDSDDHEGEGRGGAEGLEDGGGEEGLRLGAGRGRGGGDEEDAATSEADGVRNGSGAESSRSYVWTRFSPHAGQDDEGGGYVEGGVKVRDVGGHEGADHEADANAATRKQQRRAK